MFLKLINARFFTMPGSSTNIMEQLTLSDVKAIQKESQLSDKQTYVFLKNIRLKFGRKSVEPGIKVFLKKIYTQLKCRLGWLKKKTS